MKNNSIIIDASNIRGGGGLTHLREIISNGEPVKCGISKVIIWSNSKTLAEIPEKDWLEKRTHKLLNKSFIWSFYFQIFLISKLAKKENCSLVFAPGGTFLGSFRNIVSMSRNMLPFEKKERDRFPGWKRKLRFRILETTQSFTFRRSKGVIFLSQYARDYITNVVELKNENIIIPHGINLLFSNQPKLQKDINAYTPENPFKLLYVSIVTVYKHQWNVAEAVLKLRDEGYFITLDLVGGSIPESLNKLNKVLENDKNNIVSYHGLKKHEELHSIYKSADAFVFASSCENMPNILLEAMAAGLPIACSDKGPMPEVLNDAGVYFDPTEVQSIYKTLKSLLDDKNKRKQLAEKAYNSVQNYSWKDCSDKTFENLSYISKKHNHDNSKQYPSHNRRHRFFW